MELVSSVSLSDLSLLMCRNARDFCVLILYPATSPNSLTSSSSFLVASLGFSVHSIVSSANSDSFTIFSTWVPFISLIAMARPSKTMLHKSGKSGHPSRIPDPKGNAFSISQLSMRLAVALCISPLLC